MCIRDSVRTVVVTDPAGVRYPCKAFTSNWSVRLFKETMPTEDYIGKLQEGSRVHELSEEYQARCPALLCAATTAPVDHELIVLLGICTFDYLFGCKVYCGCF